MGWVVSPGNPGSDLRGGHTDTAGARDLEMPRPERRDEERERGGEELGASLGILPPGRTITPTWHQMQCKLLFLLV